MDAWQAILLFDTRGAADAVAVVLESEGVPTLVEARRLLAGVNAAFTLAVPSALAHRARWVLAQSEFSDAELTFLATGELPDGS